MKISIVTDTRRKQKTYPVCICLTHQGKTAYIATELRTTTPFKGLLFPRCEHNYAKKTAYLANIFAACESWAMDNEQATHEQAKEAIRDIINPARKNKRTLAHYCRQYAETLQSASTAAFYTRTARQVEAFAPNATFADVDADFLARFDKWLALERNQKTNSRAIIMRCLRAVFNRALDNGTTDRYPFRQYKVRQEQTEHRVLSLQELQALRDYPLADDWREQYRDLFMLSFYLAGINATDLLHLPIDALHNGRLQYTRAKTGHKFNIIVPPQASELIAKWRGTTTYLLAPMEKYRHYYDFLHHWNAGLKKIGVVLRTTDKAGGNRAMRYAPIMPSGISSYWARHTWATIAAKIGISRDIIAQCLGHSWADVTSVYIAPDTSNADKAILAVADYVGSVQL